MLSERMAYEFLSRLSDAQKIDRKSREHALRVRDTVAEIGGTERDRTLALLHEMMDLGAIPDPDIDEASTALMESVAVCMPDYLRHDEDDLARRSEALKTAPMNTRILWLIDLIDTFEFKVVRNETLDAAKLIQRSIEARDMTRVCARHSRFTNLLVRSASVITRFAMDVQVEAARSAQANRKSDEAP